MTYIPNMADFDTADSDMENQSILILIFKILI